MEPTSSPVHNRQFIIGPQAIKPKEDWIAIQLADDLYLSRCPRLRYATATDRDGTRWVLLGLAVQSDATRATPQEEISRSATADIPHAYQSWAGRWLLIGPHAIHTDAAGILGCYYRVEPEAGHWISSSLHLLANLSGLEKPTSLSRRLIHGIDFDYDPPPLTKYPGIRKLLPSQLLDLRTGDVRPRPVPQFSPQELSYEQALDAIEAYLTTTMKAIHQATGQVWLALTSGRDSRLLLAAAHKAELPIKTYTHVNPQMTRADREMPPLLARVAGFQHSFTRPSRKDSTLLKQFDRHAEGQSVGPDRAYFAQGQWSWSQPTDVMLRGHGFEVGRCVYWGRLPLDMPSDTGEAATMLLEALDGGGPPYVRESITDYLDWAQSHPYPDVDWRDRLYHEIRLCGWESAINQSLDIIEGERVNPANSSRLYSLVLSIPQQIRCRSRHHDDLMARMSPDLASLPFNQGDTATWKTRRRFSKYTALLQKYGVRAALRAFDSTRRLRRTRD